LSNPHLERDRPSVSPSPRGRKRCPENTAAASPGPEPFHVLLVEDNPTDIFVISKILAESGLDLKIQVAKDGQEALQYFESLAGDESGACPSLVLLDLNLPKVDGFEVLRQLRRDSRCDRMPVVIVTSSSAQEDRDTARQLRADAYFRKPADLSAYMELGRLVRSILRPDLESR
jgi:two-component system, chemotaxis family, response regulator Rcp1